MKFKPLTEPEVAAQGFTHRLDFDVSDIPSGIANSTAYTWNFAPLPNVPASTVVRAVEAHLTTGFSAANANNNSTTLSVGDAGLTTRFLSAVQVNANGTSVQDTIPGATTNQVYSNAAGNQLSITLNAALANFSISSLTNGRFYVLYHIFSGTAQGKEKAAPFTGSGYT
jgi:hypothetical protein